MELLTGIQGANLPRDYPLSVAAYASFDEEQELCLCAMGRAYASINPKRNLPVLLDFALSGGMCTDVEQKISDELDEVYPILTALEWSAVNPFLTWSGSVSNNIAGINDAEGLEKVIEYVSRLGVKQVETCYNCEQSPAHFIGNTDSGYHCQNCTAPINPPFHIPCCPSCGADPAHIVGSQEVGYDCHMCGASFGGDGQWT